MKFLQKHSGAAFLFAALLFTACSKDKDPANSVTPVAPVNQKTCKLLKAFNNNMDVQTYTYNSSGKVIKIKYFDGYYNKYSRFLTYTYNSAGKAAEEIEFTPDSIAVRKKVFTYNANNLLARIDFHAISATGGTGQLLYYILFQYNNFGQRVLTQEYSPSGTLYSYSQYTYKPNYTLELKYDAQRTPAALLDSVELYYDNKRSINSALGYLDEYYPELEKHNLRAVRFSYDKLNNSWQSSSTGYQYDSLGYPIKSFSQGNVFADITTTTYEYDCN